MLAAGPLLALALVQGGRVRPPVAARAVRAAVSPRLAAATGIEQIEQLSVALEAGTPAVEAVPQLFPFPLDEFQLASLRALEAERSVVVSAPTGSGKTVIAELAIYLGLARSGRIVYTTPLKALSNQKYQDLQRRFGRERVGLMTGDACLNAEAEVLVMTTEVFRNMLLEDDQARLAGVAYVVLDEFHYMNEPSRGTVWEECCILCPPSARIIALSATMSNAPQIAQWLSAIHAPTELVAQP